MRILIFSFLFVSSVFAKNITIVSDLDDTLKVTNVENWAAAVRNALFSTKAFRGMPTLVQEMESYSNDLYILSASPKMLSERVDDFLNVNKIVTKDVFLRGIFGEDPDKEKYKLEKIQYVLNNSQEDKLILIGDNMELDPKVYVKIKQQNPNRVAAIYIHKAKNIPELDGTIDYFTAYDIALNEYIEGRMDFLSASNIGREILMTKDLSLYLPDFVHCPKSVEEFKAVSNNLLTILTTQVRKRIMNYCSSRSL